MSELKTIEYVFIGLACGYSMLSISCLIQFIRIFIHAKDCKLTTQKLFFILVFVMATLRVFFFIGEITLDPSYFDEGLKYPLFALFADIPSLIFFTCYTLLILFWIDVINRATRKSLTYINNAKLTFVVINIILYIIQIIIWILLIVLGDKDQEKRKILVTVDNLFYFVLAIVASLCFAIFGGRIFFILKNYPKESILKNNRLNEIVFVTISCTVAFAARSVMTLLSVVMIDLSSNWVFVMCYYLLTEIIPTVLVFNILKALPPKEGLLPTARNFGSTKIEPEKTYGTYYIVQ